MTIGSFIKSNRAKESTGSYFQKKRRFKGTTPKFDTEELTNREYGISTNGQYLITKHQEIVTKAYICIVGDTKKTCYKQVWSTKKIEKKFLENYLINGAAIDQSIVETLVEEFPLQEVFANAYPDKHITSALGLL